MKILIVDDSTAMRRIILRSLRQAGLSGHEFSEAEDGAKGLAIVRQGGIDLVLSDWNMPEMTGIEFLSALRAEGNGIAFGFITTEGCDDMVKTAKDAGADFLLKKPFTPDDVEATIGPFIK